MKIGIDIGGSHIAIAEVIEDRVINKKEIDDLMKKYKKLKVFQKLNLLELELLEILKMVLLPIYII